MLMQVINSEGFIMFEGDFANRVDCVQAYRIILGAEATDYDGFDPNWTDDLEIRAAS